MPKVAKGGPVGSTGKRIPGVPLGDDTLDETGRVQAFLKNVGDGNFKGWGSDFCRNNLKLISASATTIPAPTGRTVFEITVTEDLCNRMGNLHGGATATIFDICTTCSLAPIAKPGFWEYAGVSRTLNVTYLRPAPMGCKILVTSEVVQAGRTVCTIRGWITQKMEDGREGKVLAIAEHGKIGIDPPVAKL